jgi:hypothetical protein
VRRVEVKRGVERSLRRGDEKRGDGICEGYYVTVR